MALQLVQIFDVSGKLVSTGREINSHRELIVIENNHNRELEVSVPKFQVQKHPQKVLLQEDEGTLIIQQLFRRRRQSYE